MPDEAPRESPLEGGARPLVLVVDDDEPLVRLCRFMLEDAGYAVLIATGGRRALELLDEERADGRHVGMVLSDVMMPVVDGLELCERVKRERPEVPVILMSAGGSMHARAVQAGADAFLAKPFDEERLTSLVRQLLDP